MEKNECNERGAIRNFKVFNAKMKDMALIYHCKTWDVYRQNGNKVITEEALRSEPRGGVAMSTVDSLPFNNHG